MRHGYTFSIVVPTCNRPTQLRECLRSLSYIDFPADRYEVIIVDDGSEQPMDNVVEPFLDQMNVTLLRCHNSGPGAARNAGAKEATGTFLAFTDDDCEPDAKWLQAMECHVHKNPETMVGGRTTNGLRQNSYAATSQIIVNAAYEHYNQNPADARFFATNNMVVPMKMFQKVGGFDEAFRVASEDREYCRRWSDHGYKMQFAPEAVIYHRHRLTFGRFFRQHFNYGRGAWQFHQLCMQRKTGSLTNALPFHLQLPQLLCRPIANLVFGQALQVGGLLLVWQLANTAGFVWEYATSPGRAGH